MKLELQLFFELDVSMPLREQLFELDNLATELSMLGFRKEHTHITVETVHQLTSLSRHGCGVSPEIGFPKEGEAAGHVFKVSEHGPQSVLFSYTPS